MADLRPIATSGSMWDTLLGLYLKEGSTSPHRPAYRTKALTLLRNNEVLFWFQHDSSMTMLIVIKKATYHADHAIILCRLFDFEDGLLYLYVKKKMYREVMQHYAEIRDTDMVLDCCDRYAEHEPDLWATALRYVCEHAEEEVVQTLLEKVDRRSSMLPIQIMDIFRRTKKPTVGLLRPYLMKRIIRQAAQMNEDAALIEEYRKEIVKMQQEVDVLQGDHVQFQPGKCAVCATSVTLPAVYFACQHAFHSMCLRNRADCPLCAAERNMVEDIQKSQQQAAEDQDAFFRQLEGHPHGFGVLTEFLGRNFFATKTMP